MYHFLNLWSDGETFISADDLRVNLWNLEVSNQSFNIVDVKPTNMEDLTGMLSSLTLFEVLYIVVYVNNLLNLEFSSFHVYYLKTLCLLSMFLNTTWSLQRLLHQLSFIQSIVICSHIAVQKAPSVWLIWGNQLCVILTRNCKFCSLHLLSKMSFSGYVLSKKGI